MATADPSSGAAATANREPSAGKSDAGSTEESMHPCRDAAYRLNIHLNLGPDYPEDIICYGPDQSNLKRPPT